MDMVKLTGLWKTKDKNGNTYLSGSLSPVSSFVVMPNTFKKEGESSSPDYYIYVAPRDKNKTSNKSNNDNSEF